MLLTWVLLTRRMYVIAVIVVVICLANTAVGNTNSLLSGGPLFNACVCVCEFSCAP